MKEKIYIYKITNKINNKAYIGVTQRSPKIRFNQHMREGGSRNTHFSLAIAKHGKENFILEELDSTYLGLENAYELERKYIKEYDTYTSGYNSTLGGEGVPKVQINDDKIISTYLKLKSSEKTAKELSISSNTVLRTLHANNIELFGSGYDHELRVDSELVKSIYYKNRSMEKTAEELSINVSTVSYKLKEAGAEIFDYGFSKEEELKIVERYKNGKESITKIATDLNLRRSSISRILKKHNAEIEVLRGRNLREIYAYIDGQEYRFESVTSCSKYLIEQKIPRSTKVKTVTEGINRSIRVGVPYYNITFKKPKI